MRYVTIAILILCINISVSLVNTIAVLHGASVNLDTTIYQSLDATYLSNNQYFQSAAQVDNSVSFGFGDFVKGFGVFIGTFVVSSIAVPYMLHQFGLDYILALPISLLVYAVYVLAIAQWISNRNLKGMS